MATADIIGTDFSWLREPLFLWKVVNNNNRSAGNLLFVTGFVGQTYRPVHDCEYQRWSSANPSSRVTRGCHCST